MRKHSRLLKRLFVLSVLLGCLGWLSFADIGNTALARLCCRSCPGFENPGEEITYCTDKCGGVTSGNCYNTCMNWVYSCYRSCTLFCDECGGCPPGYHCYEGSCLLD